MLIYLKDQNEILAIDYRGQSPSKLKADQIFGLELPKEYKNANRDIVRYGYKASTIPGTVSGLLLAHAEFGKLPLKEVMKPAIDQAMNGFHVSFDLEQAIGSAPHLSWDDESSKTYLTDGKPLKEGSVMKRPDLANTMNLISENGSKGFYEGEVAQKMVDDIQSSSYFWQLITRWVKKKLVTHFSDATSYYKAYGEIHCEVKKKLREMQNKVDKDCKFIVVAHSLGAMILSDFIYDHQKPKSEKLALIESLKEIITFGANIPLFRMGFKNDKRVAISGENGHGERINWNNYLWPYNSSSDLCRTIY